METSVYSETSNSKAFRVLSILAFVIALCSTVAGIILLSNDFFVKAFIGVSYVFSLTSSFTLAKVLRDRHESNRVEKKIENARTEHIINKYKPKIEE